MNVLQHVGCSAIKFYQKVLSPLKGYSCAYGHVHGTSCSQVVMNNIKEEGFFKGVSSLKPQLAKCASTYEDIKDDIKKKKEECSNSCNSNGCLSNNGTSVCAASDPTLCAWGASDILDGCDGPGSCEGLDGCDIGDCDIGACDL